MTITRTLSKWIAEARLRRAWRKHLFPEGTQPLIAPSYRAPLRAGLAVAIAAAVVAAAAF